MDELLRSFGGWLPIVISGTIVGGYVLWRKSENWLARYLADADHKRFLHEIALKRVYEYDDLAVRMSDEMIVCASCGEVTCGQCGGHSGPIGLTLSQYKESLHAA